MMLDYDGVMRFYSILADNVCREQEKTKGLESGFGKPILSRSWIRSHRSELEHPR